MLNFVFSFIILLNKKFLAFIRYFYGPIVFLLVNNTLFDSDFFIFISSLCYLLFYFYIYNKHISLLRYFILQELLLTISYLPYKPVNFPAK